ncbi:SdpI family protein [Devosia sp. 63-57]|uniref:SdpI family protein n=1 Tax=Devosia sp. 63-57 TaxID=1895751 RepID=UPI000869F35F|nr:SdpI family protein [Devosia sp. 63-57]ODT49151.1 MAG: hypothetical protein ABS74_09460 [Pelagibacterium sp. SCN 63-126]ODU86062.1 MAG: hypothetical protein ABT14_10550 [Pelagibacterium sp. SCN 63-17]OJX43331.1 MAG: hypothetical protein BGO80_18310 [Devosia sp. 63-57]
MADRPILNLFNRVLFAVLVAITIAGFFLVPLDRDLPVHWDISGVPDAFAPAAFTLLMPFALVVFIVAGMAILRPAGLRQDFEAGRHVIHATISLMLVLAMVIAGSTIAVGLGQIVDMPRLIAFVVGAMALVIGNYTPKMQQNWVAGIRLPWTLRDPHNWRVTHRWGGRLMMIAGLVIVIAAIINPPSEVLFMIITASLMLASATAVVISYALARR